MSLHGVMSGAIYVTAGVMYGALQVSCMSLHGVMFGAMYVTAGVMYVTTWYYVMDVMILPCL